jgi:hypothetical protein
MRSLSDRSKLRQPAGAGQYQCNPLLERRKGEVRRILLPRIRVNKRLVERLIRRFIADSSLCVHLLGVDPTQLDNDGYYKASHHKEWRDHLVLRLSVQGSIVAVLMALGAWGMVTLGSDSLTAK